MRKTPTRKAKGAFDEAKKDFDYYKERISQ